MNSEEHYDNLFVFTSSVVGHFKNSHNEHQIYLVDNICENLIRYQHDKKSNDMKHLYIKYYLHGLTDRKDFDEIVEDGAFHLNGYDNCKNFFLECYEQNRYFFEIFQENAFYSSPSRSKREFKGWLEKSFCQSYKKFHNIDLEVEKVIEENE
jgi:hypothetical protein